MAVWFSACKGSTTPVKNKTKPSRIFYFGLGAWGLSTPYHQTDKALLSHAIISKKIAMP